MSKIVTFEFLFQRNVHFSFLRKLTTVYLVKVAVYKMSTSTHTHTQQLKSMCRLNQKRNKHSNNFFFVIKFDKKPKIRKKRVKKKMYLTKEK